MLPGGMLHQRGEIAMQPQLIIDGPGPGGDETVIGDGPTPGNPIMGNPAVRKQRGETRLVQSRTDGLVMIHFQDPVPGTVRCAYLAGTDLAGCAIDEKGL